MSANGSPPSSTQKEGDARIRNVVLSTEAGMSIYPLSNLGEVMDDPIDRTCTSRLNEIRQRAHDNEEDQTTDVDTLIVELDAKFGHEQLKWDIYTQAELDEGFLVGYNRLNWEDVASGLESVQSEQEGTSSIRNEGVEGSAGMAEIPRVGTETLDETTEAAKELVAPIAEEDAEYPDLKLATESTQSEIEKENTKFSVSPTYPGDEVDMADAPANESIDDKDMMDVVSSEDRQNDYKYRDAIMSD